MIRATGGQFHSLRFRWLFVLSNLYFWKVFYTMFMRNYINNIIALPFLHRSLKRGLKVQKRFMQKTIEADIEEIKKIQDGSLTEKDFKKITGYYGFAVPAILGEGFCMLRGIEMTTKERYALTYLGALTGLFDDFFDEKHTDEGRIKTLIETPNENLAKNVHELLFIRFYQKARENSGDIHSLKDHALKVYEAQKLSKKQNLPEIGREEIEHITQEKGGVALLLYRSVFGDNISKPEKMMIYHLGFLSQLENDIFDVFKDYQAKLRTLATIETNMDNLRAYYAFVLKDMFSFLAQTEYPDKNKKKFIRFTSFIVSRGFVCLDCLEKSQKSTNNVFNLQYYKRRELICDMEKARNILRLFHHYAKCNT